MAPYKPSNQRPSSDRRGSYARKAQPFNYLGQTGPQEHARQGRQPAERERPLADRQAGDETAGTGLRLNRFLAGTGLCSRRKADELIAQGRVTINGRAAQAGDRVLPQDTVRVDGEVLKSEDEKIVLMLHKPVEVVSTAHDPQGRRTVLDFVPQRYSHLRLFPVGRLDYYSEGLILLTNDGALAQRLMHPSHSQRKVYQVLVRGKVTEAALSRMRQGMTLAEGDVTAPASVVATSHDRGTLLTITLRQGLNRQIRRMCRDTNLTVLRLKRVAEAGLELGNLPPGETRKLSFAEVAALWEERPADHGTGLRAEQHAGHRRDSQANHRADHKNAHREARPQNRAFEGSDKGKGGQLPCTESVTTSTSSHDHRPRRRYH